MLTQLIFVLLFTLSAGVFLTLGLNSVNVGRRYFWMHGLGAVAITLAAYLILGRETLPARAFPWLMLFLVSATVFSLTMGSRAQRAALPSFTVAAAASFLALSFLLAPHAGPSLVRVLANGFLSMGLLGFSMAAMLLGHWYLIQPRLSIDELKRVSVGLIALVIVRFFFSTWGVADLLADRSEAEIYKYLLSTSPGIFVLMRWAWGLLGTLVLSYFLWGTVKIRSTQSATGILYVMVLGILTGETLSLYLTLNYGIPL